MFAVKLQTFPNRETRATLYQVSTRARRVDTGDRLKHDEECLNSPECVPQSFEASTASLDITSELEDSRPERVSKQKPGFGGDPKPTKFGNNARRTLLRAGGALELMHGGATRVLFLTGTLPGSTDTAMDAIARYSSYVVHRLKTWVRDNGGSSYAMYVWERQKRGALHIHYAVYIEEGNDGRRIYHGFKQYWYKLMCAVSDQSGVDLFAKKKGGSWRSNPKVVQAKAVWCQRSVAAYLAKYLSKKVNCIGEGGWAPTYYPVRWWGVSRPLLAKLREASTERIFYSMSRRQAECFYTDISAWMENTSDKCYSYTHRYTGSAVTVAYNTLNTGEQIWHLMRTTQMSLRDFNDYSNSMESISTQLLGIVRRYYLMPKTFSQVVSPYCGTIAEELWNSKSLNTIEAMEILHGTHFLLQWRYRDRSKRPPSLETDMKFLETNLATLLEQRRLMRNQSPIKDGKLG